MSGRAEGVGFTERSFPVLRVGSRAVESLPAIELSAGDSGELWALRRMVFEARMNMLKHLLAEGLQPCSEPTVRILVEVEQRAVSTEAGVVGMLEPLADHVRTYQHEGLSW